jgi:hypothetical protein
MFLARMFLFRMHESPRYLVHTGRPQEALETLQLILQFNGSDLELDLRDVDDTRTIKNDFRDAGDDIGNQWRLYGDSELMRSQPSLPEHGASVFDAEAHRCGHGCSAPREALPEYRATCTSCSAAKNKPLRHPSYQAALARGFTQFLCEPLISWRNRVLVVLAPEWFRTTLLVWVVWWGLSLGSLKCPSLVLRVLIAHMVAYTMFNVFLPKILETKSVILTARQTSKPPRALEESLWDIVIFTVGACPGAIVRQLL